MHHLAYSIFILVVCTAFISQVKYSRIYGEHLRELRRVSHRVYAAIQADTKLTLPTYMSLLVHNKENEVIFAHNCKNNEEDLMRLMVPLREDATQFVANIDLENMAPTLAMHKSKMKNDQTCIAIMDAT